MIVSGNKSAVFWQRTRQRFQATGFALVELLAVCTLLLVVSFLLLPTLLRTKQKTTQIRCQSNLKHLGLALQIYSDANREFLPGPLVALVNAAYDDSSTNQLAWFIAER